MKKKASHYLRCTFIFQYSNIQPKLFQRLYISQVHYTVLYKDLLPSSGISPNCRSLCKWLSKCTPQLSPAHNVLPSMLQYSPGGQPRKSGTNASLHTFSFKDCTESQFMATANLYTKLQQIILSGQAYQVQLIAQMQMLVHGLVQKPVFWLQHFAIPLPVSKFTEYQADLKCKFY